MKRLDLRIIWLEEGEDFQFEGTESIFNKTIEETFPNLSKHMLMKGQEACRISDRLHLPNSIPRLHNNQTTKQTE